MKNNLTDLNNYLFEAIERINDDELNTEDLEKEIKRAETITRVAEAITKNAELQFKAIAHAQEYGYMTSGENVIKGLIEG